MHGTDTYGTVVLQAKLVKPSVTTEYTSVEENGSCLAKLPTLAETRYLIFSVIITIDEAEQMQILRNVPCHVPISRHWDL